LLDVYAAGDEPLMLARAVPGAAVVVGADRFASGCHAETALGATVHVLDDGFQHVQLARDLDLVVTPSGALASDHVLPKGRLREPIDALSRASVLVVVGADEGAAAEEARRYGVPRACGARRLLGTPVAVHGGVPPHGARIVALAGIGQPAQFASALSAAGWQVVASCAFGDHHWFTPRDLAAAARTVAAHDAWGLLTTDKDAVRLEPLGAPPCAVARVPLTLDLPQWHVIAEAVAGVLAANRADPAATDRSEARA
jgi:tetraacyldisaccharide 4'-kinase